MAIEIEGFSVIVRKATIASRYPGGLKAYQRACPNASYTSDEHLCRIGFMNPADADRFVWMLAAAGLTPYQDGLAADVVIAEPTRGVSRPCGWLERAQHNQQVIVWLSGTQPGALTPLNKEGVHLVSGDDLEFLKHENGLDVYKHKATGVLHYVGRTDSERPGERAATVAEIYKNAVALAGGLICLGPVTDQESRQRLEQSVPMFKAVIEKDPAHWPAMWTLGKVYESLDEDVQCRFEMFSRAYRVNPDHPDVAREAGFAAMLSARNEDAVTFCRRAVDLKPLDTGLRANLALSLLLSGRVAEAQTAIEEAARQGSADKITSDLAAIIREVQAGARPCPRHITELTKAR